MTRKSVGMAMFILLWSSLAYAGDAGGNNADLAFLKDYDSIIERLNNYTVTFVDAKGVATSTSKGSSVVPASSKDDGMKVWLVRVKRKKV